MAQAAGIAAVIRPGGRPTAAAAALLEVSILNHATGAFLRDGYAATSIEGIARRARVAKRTIYARWNGKPALFLAVVQRLMAGWLSTTDAWPETDDLETALRFAARSILTVGLTKEAIALHRLMVAEATRFPELGIIMTRAGVQVAVGRIAGLLDQAIAAGKMPPSDTAWAAEAFLHLVLAGPQRRALGLGPPFDTAQQDAWASSAVRLFLLGYLPRAVAVWTAE